ncbi:MAG: glycosyltransferase family 1 protein [Pseudomonadota bacterium]
MNHENRPDVYFDLSEIYFSSSRRFPYYGIARTVREVAIALSSVEAEVGFAIYSPAHERFFEPSLQFRYDEDFTFPRASRPKQVRQGKGQNAADALLRRVAGSVVNAANRVRWAIYDRKAWAPVDLGHKKLISFARPKILSSYFRGKNKIGQFYPMVHDLIPLHDMSKMGSQKFAQNFLHDTQVVVQNATRLIANSHFTKGEIEAFAKKGCFGQSCPPISTVQLAHEFRFTQFSPARAPGSDPYFLCVGTQTGRKNVEVILRALLRLAQMGRAIPKIVLAGAKRKRTIAMLRDDEFASVRAFIEFAINPSEAELSSLYSGAEALIIPSKMEGWGLPLGEALWKGTPGIAANIPALKEVGGETADYFDPDNADELAEILNKFEDQAFRQQLKSRVRAAKPNLRTWKDVARETLAVVQ